MPPMVVVPTPPGQLSALCQKPCVAGHPPGGGGGTLQVTRLEPSSCSSTLANVAVEGTDGLNEITSGPVTSGPPLKMPLGEYSKEMMALPTPTAWMSENRKPSIWLE